MVASDEIQEGDRWEQWCYWCRKKTMHTAVHVTSLSLQHGQHRDILAERCEYHDQHGRKKVA